MLRERRAYFSPPETQKFLIKMMDSSHSGELTETTMKQRASGSIFQTFRELEIILSATGFLPLRVDSKNLTIQSRSRCYTAFFATLYSAALLVVCYIGQQEPDAEESLLVRYGNYVTHLLDTSMALFVVLFNYLKRHDIANCLQAMHHFDCLMEVGQMQPK